MLFGNSSEPSSYRRWISWYSFNLRPPSKKSVITINSSSLPWLENQHLTRLSQSDAHSLDLELEIGEAWSMDHKVFLLVLAKAQWCHKGETEKESPPALFMSLCLTTSWLVGCIQLKAPVTAHFHSLQLAVL